MSGSWELQQQNQVLVVILTRELVTTAWAHSFKSLYIPGTWTFLSGMPFGMARNVGCQKALELDFQYLMFLDDDTVLPSDAILRLLAHKLPIVSGLYYRRNQPIVPVMLKETPQGRHWITDFKVGDLVEVDYVGSGCMLIHRDVLTSLPPINVRSHWFEWRVDAYDLPPHERMSEDFAFCKHAREVGGYKIIVDTSVSCKHIGLGCSQLGGTYTPAEII